jgi:signal transduction histidine kinase
MTAARDRLRRIDLRSIDALAAVLVSLDLILEPTLENGIPHRLATAVAGLLVGAMVAVRRTRPATAVIGCSLVALAQQPFHGQLFSLDSSVVLLPFALCAYGAGAWLPWRTGVLAVATATALLIATMAIETYVTEPSSSGGFGTGIVLSLILFGVPWLVGRFIAERGRRADAFTLLAHQTEAEQAQRARAAIEQERMRIGSDLQDIIAHSVSVMVVQAGGARRLMQTEPERARESILNVERTGRETLAEMRRLLGLLRADQDPRALSPQPGLDQIDELIQALRQTGLLCEVKTEGDPVELTPGIDLVGYRVIEAALSRAAEARCTQARTRIRYTRGWLEFEVDGDRPAPDARAGLASVTERVDLYGGRLTVEPDGPFAVRCRLPLEAFGVS